jgi:sporulation protein YlmC with PRC-barrel domain
MHEAEDDAMIVQPFAISVEALEDMDIYGSAGEEIGEVEDVLVDASGQPVAVTADVGGFLGIGEREVVIGLDQLTQAGDRLTVGMTKEQIEALPEFADD